MDLSLNIRAIISQRLVLGVDGKRCAAIEILMNTPHIAELILKGEVDEIKVAMEEYMACAVGGCASCVVRVETDSGPVMQRVCVDGPVFDANAVFP